MQRRTFMRIGGLLATALVLAPRLVRAATQPIARYPGPLKTLVLEAIRKPGRWAG